MLSGLPVTAIGNACTVCTLAASHTDGVRDSESSVSEDYPCPGPATTREERDAFRGSKYVQSDMTGVFRNVKNDLKAGKLVLFSGDVYKRQVFPRVHHRNPGRLHLQGKPR